MVNRHSNVFVFLWRNRQLAAENFAGIDSIHSRKQSTRGKDAKVHPLVAPTISFLESAPPERSRVVEARRSPRSTRVKNQSRNGIAPHPTRAENTITFSYFVELTRPYIQTTSFAFTTEKHFYSNILPPTCHPKSLCTKMCWSLQFFCRVCCVLLWPLPPAIDRTSS